MISYKETVWAQMNLCLLIYWDAVLAVMAKSTKRCLIHPMWSGRLFVWLFAHITYLNTRRRNFTKFSTHYPRLSLGPLLVALQYVCIVLPVCQWRHVFTQWFIWTRIKDDAYVLSSLPGGSTSRTSDNVVWFSLPGTIGRSLLPPTAFCCFMEFPLLWHLCTKKIFW